jgi:hypothetical protein
MKLFAIVSQSLVEYGSITAFLTALREGVETYIGEGHLKYLVLILPCVVLLFWLRRH